MRRLQVFTLDDGAGMQLQVCNWGARMLSCRVPVGDGAVREVLLGHPRAEDHLHEPGYFGAVIGRYANRIRNAQFALDGRLHTLCANVGPHALHGGLVGFDRRPWRLVSRAPRQLVLQLDSRDGDQGFPGALRARVCYALARAGELSIAFEASSTAACPVSLTSHGYFNLDAEPQDCRAHRLTLHASHYLPVDKDLLPLGHLADVAGTAFDLRHGQVLDHHGFDRGALRTTQGYDHCFVLDPQRAPQRDWVAQLTASDGRLRMQLRTDLPALQVYSGYHLSANRGRDGRPYAPYAGLALEPQMLPDGPNHPGWADHCVLRPGQTYRHALTLRFEAMTR